MLSQEQIKNALVRTYGWNGNNLGNTLNLTYSFASSLPYWKGYDFQFGFVTQGTIKVDPEIRTVV